MKVAYWPGCVSRGFTPELHGSMAKVAPLLDIELVELDRASCCGAGVIAEHNQELADTLNARTFALAQQEIANGAALMMNICSTCQGAQSECQERLDANTDVPRPRQRDAVGRGADVREGHHQQALPVAAGRGDRPRRDQGEGQAAADRTCASGPFYGCYIVRPTDRLGIDDEHPRDTLPAAADRGARRHGRRLRRPVQVLRLPDHHDEQAELAASRRAATSATRSTPRPTAWSRRARCATSTSTCSSRWPRGVVGRAAGHAGPAPARSSSGSPSGLDPKELGHEQARRQADVGDRLVDVGRGVRRLVRASLPRRRPAPPPGRRVGPRRGRRRDRRYDG